MAPVGFDQAQMAERLGVPGLSLCRHPHQPLPQHVQVGFQPLLVQGEEGRVEVDIVLSREGLHLAPGQ